MFCRQPDMILADHACIRSAALLITLMLLGSSAVGDESAVADNRLPETVDFERHVAPLFGRYGCNSATCHGALGGGKGGLQLSLFGHSPRLDFHAIGDRIDREDVAQSRLLLKPTGSADHEGGVRFDVGSLPHRAIERWIQQGGSWQQGSGSVVSLEIIPAGMLLELPVRGNAAEPTTSCSARPNEVSQLTVYATFADGSRENVSPWCRFSSRDDQVAVVDPGGRVSARGHGETSCIVSYANAFATALVTVPFPPGESIAAARASHPIDIRIAEKLERLNLRIAGPTDDQEFLRRLMIDTVGTIPTPAQVLDFCRDQRPDKRQRKIDELLADPSHASLWATRMCDITRCDVDSMGEQPIVAARRAQMWHDWFRKRFAANQSYAEIVRGVLTATSREGENIRDWLAKEEQLVNLSRQGFDNDYAKRETLDLYWRRVGTNSEAVLKSIAELTAAAFTGVRLNCAQCHKHPFDRWTQNDYAAFANIFSGVVHGSSPGVNIAIMSELEDRRERVRSGEDVAPLPRIREVFLSRALGRRLAGSDPRSDVSPRAFNSRPFLDAEDPRQQFVDWLLAADNPYFAPNFVNRVWAHYFGRGLVDPVDDFSIANPPSHPDLLADLAERFRESNFDIRQLERWILTSATYQRSAEPVNDGRDQGRYYSRHYIRPMLAEVAFDVINKALGTCDDHGEYARKNALAIEIGSNQLEGQTQRSLQLLGRGERESICDCDRRVENDLRQYLFLINDQVITDKLARGSIRQLLRRDDEPLTRRLYLRMLGRQPTPAELATATTHLAAGNDRASAFDDLVWALLNSREFITNH